MCFGCLLSPCVLCVVLLGGFTDWSRHMRSQTTTRQRSTYRSAWRVMCTRCSTTWMKCGVGMRTCTVRIKHFNFVWRVRVPHLKVRVFHRYRCPHLCALVFSACPKCFYLCSFCSCQVCSVWEVHRDRRPSPKRHKWSWKKVVAWSKEDSQDICKWHLLLFSCHFNHIWTCVFVVS